MPRHGHNPVQPVPPRFTCDACNKPIRSRSGLTQHRNQCPVLLERRLRRRHDHDVPDPLNGGGDRDRAPRQRNLGGVENENPNANNARGGDDFGAGNDFMPPEDMDMDDDDGGGIDGPVLRVRRTYHEGLTGA